MTSPVVLSRGIGDDPPTASLYYGIGARAGLKLLPSDSVQAIVTSPPYWSLRDYGTDPEVWGGDPACDHQWIESACTCGAWKGQLGLEPTPDLFVRNLVEIFREARRVLRPDGVLWLNLGDSYAGGGRAGKNPEYHQRHTMFGKTTDPKHTGKFGLPQKVPKGLKPKDLIGIPWRVALALQADGWWLRSDVPWIKKNPMPSSVTDRPVSGHEYWFLLSKSRRYFYDHVAVRVDFQSRHGGADGAKKASERNVGGRTDGYTKPNGIDPSKNGGRNFRSGDSWVTSMKIAEEHCRAYADHLSRIRRDGGLLHDPDGSPIAIYSSLKAYKGAHFAVFNEEVITPLLQASASAGGCCSACGLPYERGEGWVPGCSCEAPRGRSLILDPFSGSATTGLVSFNLGLNYIGIDRNQDYLDLAKARLNHRKPPEPSGFGEIRGLLE